MVKPKCDMSKREGQDTLGHGEPKLAAMVLMVAMARSLARAYLATTDESLC
jgi:hypothetical protein